MRPENNTGLADVVEKILDKGLVLNADIVVSVSGTELLGIKIRAALASFETAAKCGLEFPSGTNLNAPYWKEISGIVACPLCGEELSGLIETCPNCGWTKKQKKKITEKIANVIQT